MRLISFFALACLIAAGAAATLNALIPVWAAQSPNETHIAPNDTELLVFEARNCPYCFIFRRDVAPKYARSPRAKNVPMRFVDVNEADLSKIRLKRPITIVPTIVLMEKGRESDRISGYMGPEPFFHMVSRLMN